MNPPEPLAIQGMAFAVAGLTGVAVGLLFDGQRALRRAVALPRWLGHALDAAFVVAALPIVAAGLLAANWGELRFYPVLALLLGATLYLLLGSPVVLPAWIGALRGGLHFIGLLLRALSWPVRACVAVARRLRRRGPPDLPGAA